MTIVTANTRLARVLRRDIDRQRKDSGARFWETPAALPWRAWIAKLWGEMIYSGRDSRLMLSASRERVLWESVIRTSQDGEGLLNPRGTAEVAAQAWKLLHDWRLPQPEQAFQEVPDTKAFFGWMRSFQGALKSRGFVTEAELPDLLLNTDFERPDAFAGFDELTPVQRSMFEGVEEMALSTPRIRSRQQTGLADAEQEMRSAARWARERLEQDPTARVGVVFPDLSKRRLAAGRIFEEILGTSKAFHISAPPALAETPLIADALLVVKLCSGLTLAEAGVLLRSPYFPFAAQEGARADLSMRRRGVARVTLESSEMARLFPRLRSAESSKRPSAWSKVFSGLVVGAGWPGSRTLSSEEFQAAEAWQKLLAEFSRLDAVLGELDFSSAFSRLEELAQDTAFGAEEQDEPVQIIGVLEAAGARFDALWVGGLHDGAWPAAGRPHPFLPLALQRAAGVPNSSAELQYSYAKSVTARLLASASEVVCSYPLREGEEGLRASPLIAGLARVEMPQELGSDPLPELEELTDDAAPPLDADRFVKGGMSVIADQSACPFRAFARHRLGARGLDEVEPGLTDRERGTVVHAALEEIWSSLRSHESLMAAGEDELRELVEGSVRHALEGKLGEGSRSLTRIQALEMSRLSGILSKWLRIERDRPAFETRQIEMKRRCTVGGLELEIRADRVDRYADGTLAILDYKTGITSRAKQWEDERPEAPQLPLYSMMMEEPVATVAFAQLAAGDLKLIGISECADSGLKAGRGIRLSQQIDKWRVVLNMLAAGFVAGDAAVDPTAKACQYCDLTALCRVSAAGKESSDD
jgi:ATP-dependent helicase/nuclease subunit B